MQNERPGLQLVRLITSADNHASHAVRGTFANVRACAKQDAYPDLARQASLRTFPSGAECRIFDSLENT